MWYSVKQSDLVDSTQISLRSPAHEMSVCWHVAMINSLTNDAWPINLVFTFLIDKNVSVGDFIVYLNFDFKLKF